MKVLMIPTPADMQKEVSGIATVVKEYARIFPKFGIELVDKNSPNYDLKVVHAGATGGDCDVAMIHGLYPVADYRAPAWEYSTNARVIDAIRHAKETVVPSEWVADLIARNMRFRPHVIPHGINWQSWQHNEEDHGFVLFNKNRASDVCNPMPIYNLARNSSKIKFVTTFAPKDAPIPHNLTNLNGVLPFDQMKRVVQQCSVYLATTPETFGIGILEAMAAGKPILGFARGNIVDLVQHGVNGYLARWNDMNDLEEGLNYCLRYKKTLGENGREIARRYTWEAAVGRLLKVYRMALAPTDATYTVIIPCYNYKDQVCRAVDSCLNQTIKPKEVIVVDDGSTDGSADVVEERYRECSNVRVIRQSNGGVAIARNTGLYASTSEALVFLDADDALDPRFAEACLPELQADRSLGIVYTGLWYIKPDGEQGLSPWPTEFDFDRQLMGQNQIPTCCMCRREMLLRLGGYRQRYAPKGAGSEDAELWLRCGAYGWRAKKVTDAGLFIYSWGSGRVSSDPNNITWNTEFWRAWHPWVKSHKHPFASLAKPLRQSHPVHQCDQPIVSIVIPVGPHHLDHVIDALDSVEAQTFIDWEVIVVFDGPCDKDKVAQLKKAYPFARFVHTGDKSRGAGYARNRGVEIAKGSFLVMLDADDWLYPEFLSRTVAQYSDSDSAGIIYTDWVSKAFIRSLDDPTLAKDIPSRVVWRDEDTGETVFVEHGSNYDCERAQRQPESGRDPYLWCNITALVPTAWFREIGGFDEAMESWEDLDFWWRMARAGKCFYHLPEELMVYRLYTGTRRQLACPEVNNGQMAQSLLQYIREKYDKEGSVMGCTGCGRSKPTVSRLNPIQTTESRLNSTMADNDYVEVRLMNNNIGESMIIGDVTKRKYGPRVHGEIFLMHYQDQQARPHVYQLYESHIPVEPIAPVAAPVRIAPQPIPEPPPQPVVMPESTPVELESEVEPEIKMAEPEKMDVPFTIEPKVEIEVKPETIESEEREIQAIADGPGSIAQRLDNMIKVKNRRK